jgi:hypothetical protein
METIKFDFYTIDELIGFLYKCTFDKKITPVDFEDIFKDIFVRTPLPIFTEEIDFIVRCRPLFIGEYPPETVIDLSYPPITNKIKLQRCNYSEQQVFYGSIFSESSFTSTSFTAIQETIEETIKDEAIINFKATLSKWLIIEKPNLFILPFSKNSIEKSKIINVYKDTYMNFLTSTKFNTKYPFEEYLRLMFFISEMFIQKSRKENFYKLTSGFFNYISKLEGKRSGLIYPSANTEGAGLNIAIPISHITERKIKCEGAMAYFIDRNPENVKEISIGYIPPYIYIDDNGEFIGKLSH